MCWCDLKTTTTYGLGFETEAELEEFWDHFHEIRDILRKGKKFDGQYLPSYRHHSKFNFLRIPSKFKNGHSVEIEKKMFDNLDDDLKTVASHESIRKFLPCEDDLGNTIEIAEDRIQQNGQLVIRASPSTMNSSLTRSNSIQADQNYPLNIENFVSKDDIMKGNELLKLKMIFILLLVLDEFPFYLESVEKICNDMSDVSHVQVYGE